MQWKFVVTAADKPRVQARVLGILDHHMVRLGSFSSTVMTNTIRMSFDIEADTTKAHRIESVLQKLQDIRSVNTYMPEHDASR